MAATLKAKKMERRAFLKNTAAVGLGTVFSSFFPRSGLTQSRALAPVIVGAPFQVLMTAPHVIAAKKGYFNDGGLKVQLRDIRTGATVVEAGLAGDVNVGNSNNFSWIQGLEKGLPHVVFAQTGYEDPKERSFGFLIRKELWDKGIRDVAELKGKTFAVTDVGGFSEIVTIELLKEHGLGRNDVKVVELDYGKQAAAMASGSVDATVIPDPQFTFIIEKGYGVGLKDPKDGHPKYSAGLVTARHWFGEDYFPLASTWAIEDFAKKNPETLRAYYKAFARAVEFIKSNRREAAQIMADYIKLKIDVINRISWNGFDPKVPVDKLQVMADKLLEYGVIRKKVRIRDHVFVV